MDKLLEKVKQQSADKTQQKYGKSWQKCKQMWILLFLMTGGAFSRLKYYKLPETFLEEDILSASSLSASASAAGSEATSATSVESNNLRTENLPEFPSKVLSNLFAVHPKLCDQKFELKINDVRFVGHPLSLEVKPGEQQNYARDIRSHMTMFQVVFALRAIADYSTVEIFHDLSQQIGVAIKYEER